MERVAVYYRVSTDKQDLDSQKVAIERFFAEHRTKPKKVHVIEDEGITGKTTNRPGYRRLMDMATKGQIDTIVVFRLDRFSRDANTAIRTLLELDAMGVAFISVTQPVLNLGHEMPFRRTLLAAFAEIAEMERDAIVARVRSGLEAAKKRGVRLGPPIKLDEAMREKARQLKAAGKSHRKIAAQLDISVGSVSALLAG